ncbi:Alanine racemase, biosynthetic [BD1-7 clade bacterium]|uniref:Alanine racemase n=1 Tax=BD1-7 clade bacterium TaxID=2029982 RepID=A0A5S9QJK4_9GAMM|nr:Alanine racemase, biosynthetic [BD1-7 clade bacterium]CAA0120592.1 Alanine racemase, biosynthetic [BD1-7 clade bacterium]
MQTLSWADIDLSAIAHNFDIIRQSSPNQKTIAVIKANGYGHGALEIAKTINADALGVARIHEAKLLRDKGIQTPIIVMSELLTEDQFTECEQLRLEPVIHSAFALNNLKHFRPQANRPFRCWLKADSGMHRLGLNSDQLETAKCLFEAQPNLDLAGLITHLASAEKIGDPKNTMQANAFKQLAEKFEDVDISIANSAATLFHPDLRGQWLRIGISLYGINPAHQSNAVTENLKPAMTVRSRIIDIKDIPLGDRVGYNGIWQATRPSRIAIIGIGYADGYPRHAKNGTPVLINGERFPLSGRVSMDMISVDITDTSQPLKVGDVATLWGEGLDAEEVAQSCDTIAYELFTNAGQRVTKIYR